MMSTDTARSARIVADTAVSTAAGTFAAHIGVGVRLLDRPLRPADSVPPVALDVPLRTLSVEMLGGGAWPLKCTDETHRDTHSTDCSSFTCQRSGAKLVTPAPYGFAVS